MLAYEPWVQFPKKGVEEMFKANARLIAQSPAMFELIKWLSKGYGVPIGVQEEALAIIKKVEEGSK